MCSYNSKKNRFKQKNGLKSDVRGVCSENVYQLEEMSSWQNYIHLTSFKVVTVSEKAVGN